MMDDNGGQLEVMKLSEGLTACDNDVIDTLLTIRRAMADFHICTFP
jgi:hypothetical protein